MANPLVKIAVPVAGILASTIGKKATQAGWGAVFGEDPPTPKAAKASKKDTAQRRKEAKKEGRSQAEIARIRDPQEDLPGWKLALWTVISGIVLQGLRQAAKRGAANGTEKLVGRRPRPNRG